MSIVSVTIPNWDKFNPRNDRKNYVWFRFQNNFFSDQKVFSLNGDQQRLLIFIYCLGSEKNTGSVEVNISYASAMLKITENKIINDLRHLSDNEIVMVADSLPLAYQTPSNGIATRRTNVRDVRTTLAQTSFDLESLYISYPRKIGKKSGIKKLEKIIKSVETFNKMQYAISNYSKYCSNKNMAEKYIKYFPTFISSWEDWLDVKEEKSETQKWLEQSESGNID